MQISDETLMALADHELDPQTAARVSQAVAADPALAARLKRFTETRRLLKDADRAPQASTPAEDPLAAMIRASVSKSETAVPVSPQPANLNRRPLLAAAASIAIAAVGLGWWVSSDRTPDGLSLPELAALDSLPSGESRALAGGAELTMIASFRAASGALCREYETVQTDSTRTTLACHEGDGWQERFAAVAETGAEGYQPASGEEQIDAALARLGAGDPLSPDEEAAALGSNPPG